MFLFFDKWYTKLPYINYLHNILTKLFMSTNSTLKCSIWIWFKFENQFPSFIWIVPLFSNAKVKLILQKYHRQDCNHEHHQSSYTSPISLSNTIAKSKALTAIIIISLKSLQMTVLIQYLLGCTLDYARLRYIPWYLATTHKPSQNQQKL